MIDTIPLVLLASGGALALGLLAGWLLRGARNASGVSDADWRLRLAARDRDVEEAEHRLASLVRAVEALDGDMDAAARLVALDEELSKADEELDRLRALEIDKTPASESIMARRLEELEVELATLESLRCPEPSAHRRNAEAG